MKEGIGLPAGTQPLFPHPDQSERPAGAAFTKQNVEVKVDIGRLHDNAPPSAKPMARSPPGVSAVQLQGVRELASFFARNLSCCPGQDGFRQDTWGEEGGRPKTAKVGLIDIARTKQITNDLAIDFEHEFAAIGRVPEGIQPSPGG